METTQEIVDRLRAYKEKFADKYGIEQLGLFGSVARGEQDEKSDIRFHREELHSLQHTHFRRISHHDQGFGENYGTCFRCAGSG